MGVRLMRYDKKGVLGGPTATINDHNEAINRDLPDQHPIYAITDLQDILDGLTNEDININTRIDNIKLLDGVEDTDSIDMDYNPNTKIIKANVKVYKDEEKTNAIKVTEDGLYVSKIFTQDTKTVSFKQENHGESLKEIYENGIKFSHNSNSWSNLYSSAEANAWYWNESLYSFVQPKNTSYFNGFISSKQYDDYEHIATIVSSDTDDDLNGIVIAYVVDDSGHPHTITACVDAGGYSNIRWGLVYDYYLPDAQNIIVNQNIPGNRPNRWQGSKITIRVTKNQNIITATCSNWGSDVLNENTKLEIDLNNYSWGHYFTDKVQYGYCNLSQAYSYFTNIVFNSFDSASSTTIFASVNISEEPGNEIVVKDDGIYAPEFVISPDQDNALEKRANGYYVNKVSNIGTGSGCECKDYTLEELVQIHKEIWDLLKQEYPDIDPNVYVQFITAADEILETIDNCTLAIRGDTP